MVRGEIVAATLNVRWDDREEPFCQGLSLRIKIHLKLALPLSFSVM